MGNYDRRTILRGTGLAFAGVLAGCSDGGDGGGADGDDGGTDGEGSDGDDGDAGSDGTDATESPEETPTPVPLSIENAKFITDRPEGFRQYTEVSDTRYATDETIWVYFEPKGVGTESAGEGQVRFSLTTSLTIVDPDGNEIYSQSKDVGRTVAEDRDLSELFLFWEFDLPDSAPDGRYTARVGFTDTIRGGSTEQRLRFTVTQGLEFQEAFRSAITSKLDVEIERLAVNDGTVNLVYETPHAGDSSDSDAQVGYIAGAYAGLVDSGWENDELRVHFTDANGDEYRWLVEATTAQQFMDEEISRDEYVQAIFETLEKVRG
jgi:hypothetical protein